MTLHSPSGLASLELCPRRYTWDKVDMVPREPNAYAAFGIKVHKYLENYYRSGIMPPITEPEGNCAVALLAHLPPPQPGVRIEEHREHGRFHGYPDLTFGNRVFDHKTTSDHKWAKTPLSLLDDLQACIYASFILHETGSPTVTLQWNYVTRHKPRVLPIVQEVNALAISSTVARANRLADQADTILAKGLHALDLPPNVTACDAYGGCPHRVRCNLTPGDRMEGLMNMTSAADFMATMNAQHPPAPAPADPTAGWQRANGHRLNPTTNAWEPDAPPAPPPPPAAAAVPINPPPAPSPPAPAPPAAAAPPAPPPPAPAPWTPPAPPVAPTAIASSPVISPLASEPELEIVGGEAYEAMAKGFEQVAAGFRMLSGPPKMKRGRGPGRKAEM